MPYRKLVFSIFLTFITINRPYSSLFCCSQTLAVPSKYTAERVIPFGKRFSKAVYNQRKLFFIIFHKVEAMSLNLSLFRSANSCLTLVRTYSVIGLLGVLLKVVD